jgi:DNA-binding CsgD family transcriptional regulator
MTAEPSLNATAIRRRERIDKAIRDVRERMETIRLGPSPTLQGESRPDSNAEAVLPDFRARIERIPLGSSVPLTNAGTLLSLREAQTVALIAAGFADADIAVKLGITVRTVKFHVSNAFRATATRNRAGLMFWFLQDRSDRNPLRKHSEDTRTLRARIDHPRRPRRRAAIVRKYRRAAGVTKSLRNSSRLHAR